MKPCDKSKDDVRWRRQRNLVAKNNKYSGQGFHTPRKYIRNRKLLTGLNNSPTQHEINDWWERTV
jgi:hypothetical protein